MDLIRNLAQKLKNTGNKWTQGISNLFSDEPISDRFWEELEELLKTFVEDNKIIDQEKYDNVMSILMMRYRETGDNDNIFKRIEEYISTKTSSKDEVNNALNDVKEQLDNVTKEEEHSDDGAGRD